MRTITVGRDNSCDIVMSDMCVSKMHASLTQHNDGQSFVFRDMSSNGTWINGIKVHRNEMLVRYGDSVMLTGRVPFPWNKMQNIAGYTYNEYNNINSQFSQNIASNTYSAPATLQAQSQNIDGWNWGAFVLYPIWGFFNGM